MRACIVAIAILVLSIPAYAQYSGGSGTAEHPYQIATASDLILLGETPEDYDKHFIMTADINLDPNLPGRRVFDRAVIAPETNDSTGELDIPFTGVFDGNNHTISHLTIEGESYLGLFGELGSRGNISDLGLEAVDVEGTKFHIGGLAGSNKGIIASSYCTGTVTGLHDVGGLVGDIDDREGILFNCYSTGTVSGSDRVGGLVGNHRGSITTCCSTSTVTGDAEVGGLVGYNHHSSSIALSYSTGAVTGNKMVGGLVGLINGGSITASYSTGTVTGNDVGGLVGANWSDSSILLSFWDRQTSGQSTSGGGKGLSTRAMQNVDTYLREGWDFVDEILNGTSDYWQISPADYPRLRWQGSGNIQMPEGLGTAEQPYLIRDARDMGTVWFKPLAHYRLETSLDLSGAMWSTAVIPWFGGNFDGNGHMISNLHVEGAGKLGLFGQTGSGAKISNLGLEAVDVNGARDPVGGLAGSNSGAITSSYCTGTVTGGEGGSIGGLIGENRGRITTSYSIGSVRVKDTADYYGGIGGLVGFNYGSITLSYSSGVVTGSASVVCRDCSVGGLIGYDDTGIITASYSTATVTGNNAGGLVGYCEGGTSITASYSAGAVTSGGAGGLVGLSEQPDMISSSFWDMETSGQTASGGGTGLTTLEMQDIKTYLSEGWDFESEIENGTCDYWQMTPGEYPRLRWQDSGNIQMPEGLGTAEQPYLIRDARDLGTLWFRPLAHYRLETSLDLSGIKWSIAVVPWFDGIIEGSGQVISNLHIQGSSHLGLFGQLGIGAKISNLGLEAVNVEGTDAHIGGLAGYNNGHITRSYSTGAVTGQGQTGGLVGDNGGSITTGHSSATVTGRWTAGGLVGHNSGLISTKSSSSGTVTSEHGAAGGLVGLNNGSITTSHSTGAVDGEEGVGGLVGSNQESIATCYSTGSVSGDSDVGGLVGSNGESITSCYSTGMVNGNVSVAGLVGTNGGSITMSYSTGNVTGNSRVGGVVGFNVRFGSIAYSYSTGTVTGNTAVGGLIGDDEDDGRIISCFWDIETSGQTTSQGGTGRTTTEMQTASTFLDAGWDFMGEAANGADDIWWIAEGWSYPRLWWEELYVDDDAPGDPGPDDPLVSDYWENGSRDHPFDTIQEAIDFAPARLKVIVLPGQYLTPDPWVGENISFFGKNIVLSSVKPTNPEIVADTVIRGAVQFSGTEDRKCTLTGFTIHSLGYGGIAGNHTRATISHCIISGNGPCGGTVMKDCDGTISNCLITDNTTFSSCGTFPVISGCNGLIKNCTIANNISGISVGDARIENCIIYNNDGPQIGVTNGATARISYSNIQGGLDGITGEGAASWGLGNMDVDPGFVRLGYWVDEPQELIEGDYHLRSEGWSWNPEGRSWTYDFVTSPCIDAGNPGSPLCEEVMTVPRDPDNDYAVNVRVNMGAYAGTAQASMPPHGWALLADLNNDGTVNPMDLAEQISAWLIPGDEQPGDLNRDGIVDMTDFTLLGQDWLRNTSWAR